MEDHWTAPDMRVWSGLWKISIRPGPLQMGKNQLSFSLIQQQLLAEVASGWAHEGEQLGPLVSVCHHIGEDVIHYVIHPRQVVLSHRILQGGPAYQEIDLNKGVCNNSSFLS